jgi:hypothetical protein
MSLESSHEFANKFNSELNLRFKLWKQGFMADLQMMPGLIRQEWESLSTILKILFKMYYHPKESSSDKQKLFGLCEKVIHDYIGKQTELQMLVEKREEDQTNVDDDDKAPSLNSLHENEL